MVCEDFCQKIAFSNLARAGNLCYTVRKRKRKQGQAPRRESLGMKIAIFGGSFDPVHAEHVQIARAAREKLGADKVIAYKAAGIAGNIVYPDGIQIINGRLRPAVYPIGQRGCVIGEFRRRLPLDGNMNGCAVDRIQHLIQRERNRTSGTIIGQHQPLILHIEYRQIESGAATGSRTAHQENTQSRYR